MPSSIDSRFTAGLIYYQGRNVASFKLASFLGVLRLIGAPSIASPRAVQKTLKDKNPLSQHLKLPLAGLEHRATQLLQESWWNLLRDYTPWKEGPKLTRGHTLELHHGAKRNVLALAPYVVFSGFVRRHGFSKKAIIEVLGSEMSYWTGIMLELGLPVKAERSTKVKPVKKPLTIT